MNDSKNRYYIKNSAGGTFTDITTMFDGVAILKIDGFLAKGKAINVYNAKWMDGSTDFMITSLNNSGNPQIVRDNTKMSLTFIVRQKYASSTINVMTVHDNFVAYMTNTDVWLKSLYFGGKQVHCVCEEEYKPTTIKLGRGNNSWVMGTISLTALEEPHT